MIMAGIIQAWSMFTKPDEEAPAQKEQAKRGATDWQPREKQTPVQLNQTKEDARKVLTKDELKAIKEQVKAALNLNY